jgi:prepilin-type N-terminal cleavage/methylation domain-containing protein
MRAQKKLHNAFTLVELLVVISIITILTAILIPVLSRVRANAKRLICTSNIRQCTLACILYAQDNEQWLPLGNIYNDPEKEEGWLDVNYNTALTIHLDYQVTENLAMCQAWLNEKDNFFYEPKYVDDENFKVGGTKIGFIYYGRRFDKKDSLYTPKTANGTIYKSPRKLTDAGTRYVTSDTLFTCYHWDTITSNGSWGAKIPHAHGANGKYYPPSDTRLDPAPQGLAVSYLDGSAAWTKWKKLDWLQQAKMRLYFSKRK